MTPSFRRPGVAALALAGATLLLLPACHGAKRPPALAATPGGSGSAAATTTTPAQPVDQGPDVRAVGGEGAAGSDIRSDASLVGSEGSPLADIRFDLDSATLSEAARATLEKHALWLQSHREARVTVEGHCDERGTVEYNLALGEQRARAARDYLVSLGVSAERLKTVSYGKERPLDPGQTEAAFAKNRRAHFAVGR
ncbi:MAG TPA: peptidoglycan-associated lipoprotein Pal [Vicinamibacteria bacterium]|nr:peptidoglycan-associated lipoprotein Pal [Vicinamibacteria bacterium]